jgi:hypothetical protein
VDFKQHRRVLVSILHLRVLNRCLTRGLCDQSHMRYSAVTCDPDDFTKANGWSLRTRLYATKILIAITSYDEDNIRFVRTLHSVMHNICDISKTKQSRYWRRTAEEGIPGWRRITVALIVDGLETMDKAVMDILTNIGVYQDGAIKKQVEGRNTVAHIFEVGPVAVLRVFFGTDNLLSIVLSFPLIPPCG